MHAVCIACSRQTSESTLLSPVGHVCLCKAKKGSDDLDATLLRFKFKIILRFSDSEWEKCI